MHSLVPSNLIDSECAMHVNFHILDNLHWKQVKEWFVVFYA